MTVKSFNNKMPNKFKKFILKNLLLICILISIIIGFGVGFGLRLLEWQNNENLEWFYLAGDLFIRALELFIGIFNKIILKFYIFKLNFML